MSASLVVLLLALLMVGALPTWTRGRAWGPYPAGALALLAILLLVLVLLGLA